MSDVYGPLLHPGLVERAVVSRLAAWMDRYLAEVERQDGGERDLPSLRGVIRLSELDEFPEDQTPLAVVISSGTIDDPEIDRDGVYSALYSVSVAVIVGAAHEGVTRELGQLYGAASRGCLLQRRKLSDHVSVSRWLGESLDDLPSDVRRGRFAATNAFAVALGNVVSWRKGPPTDADPAVDPSPDPVEATAVDVEVDAVESLE